MPSATKDEVGHAIAAHDDKVVSRSGVHAVPSSLGGNCVHVRATTHHICTAPGVDGVQTWPTKQVIATAATMNHVCAPATADAVRTVGSSQVVRVRRTADDISCCGGARQK